jgi:hypothetical protein
MLDFLAMASLCALPFIIVIAMTKYFFKITKGDDK